MTEVEVLDREDQQTVGQPMAARPTKRDLLEKGLTVVDPKQHGGAMVSMRAGGISFAKFEDVMSFATSIATSGMLLPEYLRGNPGACLGLTIQAIEWNMSPVGVMQKSYVVNGRVGYESQLIHAVVEARAPLQHRLDCEYNGDGPTRRCTVRGMFTSGDIREYQSPMFKDIKVKNSPLWTADLDQQLFYYSSRSWARKWCPDVLMGIYTREEIAANPQLGREEEAATAGLHARLSSAAKSDEGHKAGHVEAELEQIGVAKVIEAEVINDKEQHDKTTAKKGRGKKEKAEKKPATVEEAIPDDPKNASQYVVYAEHWIKQQNSADDIKLRWKNEIKMRNALGVTADDISDLIGLKSERIEALGE